MALQITSHQEIAYVCDDVLVIVFGTADWCRLWKYSKLLICGDLLQTISGIFADLWLMCSVQADPFLRTQNFEPSCRICLFSLNFCVSEVFGTISNLSED